MADSGERRRWKKKQGKNTATQNQMDDGIFIHAFKSIKQTEIIQRR